MGSIAIADQDGASAGVPVVARRLFVAWQDPVTREIIPVGRLDRQTPNGEVAYAFRYLRAAAQHDRFRPFIGFPELGVAYRSSELFPFFENRLMPRSRGDYSAFLEALGLEPDADPFEVLALSEGRRQTDTIEVFPEPILVEGIARCRFLVHGVRHVPGAQEAIDSLAVGEQLFVAQDPQNPVDPLAVLLRDGDFHLLGWVPRYLTALVNTPIAKLGPGAVRVVVEHIGARDGPSHLRLLCELMAHWPVDYDLPFGGRDFESFSSAA